MKRGARADGYVKRKIPNLTHLNTEAQVGHITAAPFFCLHPPVPIDKAVDVNAASDNWLERATTSNGTLRRFKTFAWGQSHS